MNSRKNRAIARAQLAKFARHNDIPIRKVDVERHVEITFGRNAEGPTTEFFPLSALGKELLAVFTAAADCQGIPYEKHEIRGH